MIISASRRTDLPALYSDWLFHRLQAGYACTRNPFNAAQVRRVPLLPQDIDCFVFWTKDPLPMLARLPELDRLGCPYYFQFTLTPYGRELEQGLRDKAAIAATLSALAKRIGRERVRWRYDPVILNDIWDIPRHRAAFEQLCERLYDSTERVTISFVDLYARVRTPLIRPIAQEEMAELAAAFAEIASRYGLGVDACCEQLDLVPYGIGQASCIDRVLIERITGKPLPVGPDPGQRPGCGCVRSVDIGAYNTCTNGCVYCYASHSAVSAARNCQLHRPEEEFLTG